MDTITLEIPRDEAEKILPFFESRRAKLLSELKAVEAQIGAIKGDAKPMPTAEAATNGGERAKKGETKKLVTDYLRSLPGLGGDSISNIAKRSGASYTSTYRTLQAMKKGGEVNLKNHLWTLTS